MENENPKEIVDSTAESLFRLAANMISRANEGEEFPKEEIEAIAKRLQDHAADLQLAASRLE
ncbi:MAG TPA: hypothetical protein VE131_16070 [Terriglobales bacterium]|jgi:hypothetical protein|nr:hypothetical protein [Terriglobales bacterium]